MVDVARAAIWYARHGWHVIPLHAPLFDEAGRCIGCTCEQWRRERQPSYVCPTPGKHPRLSDWEHNASRDLDTVAGWWRRWPASNVGVAAGRSGLLAFDLDSYKDNYQGAQLLEPADLETVTSLTGSGGSHLIYRIDEDAPYTNAKGALPSGIDIRAHGGQFVAPPSMHPSGRRYAWELGYGPHEIAPAPLPAHIAAILDAHRTTTTVPVQFAASVLPKPRLDRWPLSRRVADLIQTTPTRGQRSENDQTVISALIMAGATDDDIRAVFEHYPIGTQGRYREKGANALRYLSLSIAKARAWSASKIEERTGAALAALAAR